MPPKSPTAGPLDGAADAHPYPRPALALAEAPEGHDPYSPILLADASRPFVVAQLGQSLDGRIATPTGESRWINKDAALDHVHRIRAAVDAVVVGVGTVAADDPWLNVRRVPGRHPARVVIDPSGRMRPSARCLLGNDGVRRLVVSGKSGVDYGDGVEPVTVMSADGKLDPNAIVAALFALGLKRLLIEGGAWTVSSFIDAGAVDRLHVLVAPVILGSGKTGIALKPIERLIEARRPLTRVHVLADGDVLFDCDLRHDTAPVA
jgi:diaminohydroxyphosphoribosylaminopyrimidine deaminase / 5-amino-6-(5-phosphoribosylamino)uracil reductase